VSIYFPRPSGLGDVCPSPLLKSTSACTLHDLLGTWGWAAAADPLQHLHSWLQDAEIRS